MHAKQSKQTEIWIKRCTLKTVINCKLTDKLEPLIFIGRIEKRTEKVNVITMFFIL